MLLDILTIQNILLTTLFGGLIGLERERMIQSNRDASTSLGRNFAGIRTFILIALFGLVMSSFALEWGISILVAGFVALVALLISAHVYSAFRRDDGSILTELDAYLVFAIGVLVGQGELPIAMTLTVIVSLVSLLRHPLHHLVRTISDEEFTSSAKFAAIAFLVLPLLPDRNYDDMIFTALNFPATHGLGEFAILNPYKIWLMVVVISAISFVGYFLTKFFGNRGIELSGFLGGLYSSTTTALSLAEKSREKPKIVASFLAALFFSYAGMLPRVAIEIRALNAEFFSAAAVPLFIFFGAILAAGTYFYHQGKREAALLHVVRADNPFKLSSAVMMAVFVVIVILFAKIVLLYLDPRFIYLLALVLGLAKMDPLVVALAAVAGSSFGLSAGVLALLLGMLANGAQKILTLYTFGNRRLIEGWVTGLVVIALVVGGVVWLGA